MLGINFKYIGCFCYILTCDSLCQQRELGSDSLVLNLARMLDGVGDHVAHAASPPIEQGLDRPQGHRASNPHEDAELRRHNAARGDTAPAQWRVPSRQDGNALVAR